MTERVRVLIVDDEPLLREAFGLLIGSDPLLHVVGEAADGIGAVTLTSELRPDVVLMDVEMPSLNGLDATRMLCAAPDGPKVIMLTMFGHDEYIFGALQAGASGFLLKNAPPAELVRAVHVVSEGNALLAPEVTRRMISEFASRRSAATPALAAQLARLTARERETLTLIAAGKSNDEIATELFLAPVSVRTYVSRLLAKLQARDRTQLVVFAYSSGTISL